MTANPRPVAVVTGASTGIGFELAKCCAENGFDLLETEPASTADVSYQDLPALTGVGESPGEITRGERKESDGSTALVRATVPKPLLPPMPSLMDIKGFMGRPVLMYGSTKRCETQRPTASVPLAKASAICLPSRLMNKFCSASFCKKSLPLIFIKKP